MISTCEPFLGSGIFWMEYVTAVHLKNFSLISNHWTIFHRVEGLFHPPMHKISEAFRQASLRQLYWLVGSWDQEAESRWWEACWVPWFETSASCFWTHWIYAFPHWRFGFPVPQAPQPPRHERPFFVTEQSMVFLGRDQQGCRDCQVKTAWDSWDAGCQYMPIWCLHSS